MAYKEFKGIGPLRYGSAYKQTEYIKTGDGERIYPQITSKDSTNIKLGKKVIKLSTWFIVSSLYLSTSDKDKTIAL